MKAPEHYNTERTRLIDRYEAGTDRYFDLDEWDEIIQYYLHRMHFSEARKAINAGLELHPNAPELLYYRVRLLTDTGEHEKALSLAANIIDFLHAQGSEQVSDYINLWADVLLISGEIELKLNHLAKAKSHFESLRAPQFGDPLYAYLDAAYIYINQNLFVPGLEWIQQGLQQFPTHQELLGMASYCLANTARYEEAAKYLQQIIDQDPYCARAWMELGDIYYVQNQYAEAIDCYDYATSIQDDNLDAWKNKANAYYQTEAYRKAAECYLNHAQMAPGTVETLLLAADCYELLDDHTRASELFQQSLQRQPENAEAMEGLGICLVEMQQYEAGIQQLQRAIALDPTATDSWFYLGQALVEFGRTEEAIRVYSQSLEMDNHQAIIWLNLGLLCFDRGQYHEALQCYQQAYMLDEELENIHLVLALAYYATGQIESFQIHLQQAQDKNLDSYRMALDVFPECATYIDPLL